MPLDAELLGRGSLFLISQDTVYRVLHCAAENVCGVMLQTSPWGSPASTSLGLPEGPGAVVELGMDINLLNWHQLALQPEALKSRNIPLTNLCPFNLCQLQKCS